MSEVFISYRQTDEAQKQRVRAFAERLRDTGIDVILDQFFLDQHPAGPNEGWPQWSSACASKTDYVLIIGNQAWFQCFDGTQLPGTGLGAAREARDIFQRIYDVSGVIDDIRVVLFDQTDEVHIPIQLKGYHRFHVDHDFRNIVRWLRPVTTDDTPRISIPHNLPSLQPFFGREEELQKIADALDPESRTWGALIDGPGGMGKTSLAIRAAYDALPEDFEKIVFVSLKSRDLDDDGVRDLSGFLISGLAELLNELARELGHDEITKSIQEKRPRMLLDVLRGTRTLLVLDNLESLLKPERDIVFTFIKRLPQGCKAILTSRGRIGSGAEELILEELSQEAALATLTKLAETNPPLAKTSEAERLLLYRETGGNPLLLRWTAGQIGRGSCLTFSDAIKFLRSCPKGNDPLEFIFGDLVEDLSEAETRILCALIYFTMPSKVEHVSELAALSKLDTDVALRSLVNRSLVVPSEELKMFVLVPLVADFLQKKKPEVVTETGDRLDQYAYTLAVENGYEQYDRFHVLDAGWPTLAAALPRLVAEEEQLQTVCTALDNFLEFTGRWDEWLALSRDAESNAVAAGDLTLAGWRAQQVAWVHYLRAQSAEVLAYAQRTQSYWLEAQAGPREQASALRLRSLGHKLVGDHAAAIATGREAIRLWRSIDSESVEVVMGLVTVASAECLSGDLASGGRDLLEALRIARALDFAEGVASCTGNLAAIALACEDWTTAEDFARESVLLSEKIGRQDLVGSACSSLAEALVQQGRKSEAFSHALRSVEIFKRLGTDELQGAREILNMCESSESPD